MTLSEFPLSFGNLPRKKVLHSKDFCSLTPTHIATSGQHVLKKMTDRVGMGSHVKGVRTDRFDYWPISSNNRLFHIREWNMCQTFKKNSI